MRYWLVLLLAVFCFSLSASSQTAEELVNKNIEAKGGMDKIKAIKTWRMTGKLIAGGITATSGQENMRPNLVRETGDELQDKTRRDDVLVFRIRKR